jgi:hypothetical protein
LLSRPIINLSSKTLALDHEYYINDLHTAHAVLCWVTAVLTKYFMRRGREPFKKYTSITKKEWATFKKTRKIKHFKELSRNKRIW